MLTNATKCLFPSFATPRFKGQINLTNIQKINFKNWTFFKFFSEHKIKLNNIKRQSNQVANIFLAKTDKSKNLGNEEVEIISEHTPKFTVKKAVHFWINSWILIQLMRLQCHSIEFLLRGLQSDIEKNQSTPDHTPSRRIIIFCDECGRAKRLTSSSVHTSTLERSA